MMIVVGSQDSELVIVPVAGMLVYDDTGALVIVVDSVVAPAVDWVVF
jgi:hypothetical protein